MTIHLGARLAKLFAKSGDAFPEKMDVDEMCKEFVDLQDNSRSRKVPWYCQHRVRGPEASLQNKFEQYMLPRSRFLIYFWRNTLQEISLRHP